MAFDFDRFVYALVTSTTYGNWLPGEGRGYVDEQNVYGTPFEADMPELKKYAESQLCDEPVLLDANQAELIFESWQKEVKKKDWHLFAVSIMPNHFHLVAALARGPDKGTLLRTFKSRASFALNKRYGKRTWWTTSGSVRFSFDEHALRARIEYVKNQKNPLLTWENLRLFQ